jgi:hypothetical protein
MYASERLWQQWFTRWPPGGNGSIDPYVVTSNQTKFDRAWIQSAFASEALYGAKPFSQADLDTMLENSCTLALFLKGAAPGSPDQSVHTQIGMARIVTDYVTFAHLTDVFVDRDYQGIGLENWLIECCNEIIEGIPALRCVILLARGSASESTFQLYREMGMETPRARKRMDCS